MQFAHESENEHDLVLHFLHSEAGHNAEIEPPPGCHILTTHSYESIRQLKQMQQRLAELQMANASYRDSVGQRVIAHVARKLLRRGKPQDEIRQLSEEVTLEEARLHESVSLIEMSDSVLIGIYLHLYGDQLAGFPGMKQTKVFQMQMLFIITIVAAFMDAFQHR